MKKHVMIDIETLGTSADAVILSIGLVHFDPATGRIVKSHEFRCDQAAQPMRKIDPNTVAWWSRQSKEAQDRLVQAPLYQSPTAMLHDVRQWLHAVCSSQWDLALWAKGPSFDMILCRHMADQLGVKWKGHFSREYCVRTMLLIAESMGWQDIIAMEPELAHGAEADAIHQAKQVMAAMARIKG